MRLSWGPDDGPSGSPVGRRAIQLGLRGDVLVRYAGDWLLEIVDVSDFVAEQRAHTTASYDRLVTPRGEIHPVAVPEVAERLGVSGLDGGR